MRKIIRIFWKKNDGDLTQISYDEYKANLIDLSEKQRNAAYEKAWDCRKFEIELYWKRATYFWALIVPTFAGYFALMNSQNYTKTDYYNHAEVFIVICIGFILSVAWALVNKGSKSWQRHWEIHLDLLENKITGPLYKTVSPNETFSVSKINEIISWFFTAIWILLAYKFQGDQGLT
ncbi:RipA family octameric membrane protein [Aurantibacillus circumpalustris]|uniref:RipA family octameric membrane protein n=1 Tax=Aurantibacillus circumpalustris TaxID=3036359 RepID=UPI00295A682F|nr:hypothetical protein [Aurantibacillus circumpalustris]